MPRPCLTKTATTKIRRSHGRRWVSRLRHIVSVAEASPAISGSALANTTFWRTTLAATRSRGSFTEQRSHSAPGRSTSGGRCSRGCTRGRPTAPSSERAGAAVLRGSSRRTTWRGSSAATRRCSRGRAAPGGSSTRSCAWTPTSSPSSSSTTTRTGRGHSSARTGTSPSSTSGRGRPRGTAAASFGGDQSSSWCRHSPRTLSMASRRGTASGCRSGTGAPSSPSSERGGAGRGPAATSSSRAHTSRGTPSALARTPYGRSRRASCSWRSSTSSGPTPRRAAPRSWWRATSTRPTSSASGQRPPRSPWRRRRAATESRPRAAAAAAPGVPAGSGSARGARAEQGSRTA
mmetsp:Transcript_677/g.1622  ORF Transcript_677/g.1622 Transcript_677/m.1622 type:complete len:347 (-) Transcript_677:580-1620(-)